MKIKVCLQLDLFFTGHQIYKIVFAQTNLKELIFSLRVLWNHLNQAPPCSVGPEPLRDLMHTLYIQILFRNSVRMHRRRGTEGLLKCFRTKFRLDFVGFVVGD